MSNFVGMKALATLSIVVGCAASPRAPPAAIARTAAPVVPTASAGDDRLPYVCAHGDDVDTHVPHTHAALHHGGPGTSFRYAWGDQCTKWVVTASNEGARGLRLEAVRSDDARCHLRRTPIHRERAVTNDEWNHIISLVNAAQIETLLPEVLDIKIGPGEYGQPACRLAIERVHTTGQICVAGDPLQVYTLFRAANAAFRRQIIGGHPRLFRPGTATNTFRLRPWPSYWEREACSVAHSAAILDVEVLRSDGRLLDRITILPTVRDSTSHDRMTLALQKAAAAVASYLSDRWVCARRQ